MTRRLWIVGCHAGVLAAVAGTSSCHRQGAVDAAARSDASAEQYAQPAPDSSVDSARCRPKGAMAKAAPLSGGFEVGDALPFPGGIAVSLLHDTSEGTLASVALLAADGASPRLLDLVSPPGDAPPPRLAWRGKDIAVAEYVLRRKGARPATPELGLWEIDPTASAIVTADTGAASPGDGGPVEPSLYMPLPRHFLGFDMAYGAGSGMVAWDDATPDYPPRGVIRVAALSSDSHVGTTQVASPVDSDAEMARVVPNGSGFFVLWIARRPERAGDSGAVAGTEVTGEARTFAWLEMIAIDSRAMASSPVWRLTPSTGHISAYDVRALREGRSPALPERAPNDRGAEPTLLVIARDDGELADGSGGTLLRVRATDRGPELVTDLATEGLGRGAPILVGGLDASVAPWASWVGRDERLRLLPLDHAGAPAGTSSVEEAFDASRPLLLLANGEQMLVATLGGVRAGVENDPPSSGDESADPAGLAVFDCHR